MRTKAHEKNSWAFVRIPLRMQRHIRFSNDRLNPGTLTAPGSFCLVLLHSWPDTVHRFPSRKTRISTPEH